MISYLISPAVGAIIGYVTNAIAIKMLFRPLKEIRIGGFRVPFTPGIIPRQKKSLAINIGKMVSGELFTPQVIQEKLNDPVWQETLIIKVNHELNNILWNTPIHSYWGGEAPWEKWCLEALKALPEPELFEVFKSGLTFLTRQGQNQAPAYITQLFEHLYPQLFNHLIHWIKSPEIYSELLGISRTMVQSAFSKMNGMQKFFVSIGQYDKNIEEHMPEILDDLILKIHNLLSSEKVKNQLESSLTSAIDPETPEIKLWFHETIAKISLQVDYEQEPEIISLLKHFGSKTPGEILFPNQHVRPLWSSPEQPVAARWIVEKGLNYLTKQIESILSSLDIQTMVETRIMNLDEKEVESLLLMVLKKHLKYINLFGGILGALIGFLQNFIRF